MLDLFCGAGGAAMGYYRAGFDEIVGVDIKPQPRYPFTFIQADVMTEVFEDRMHWVRDFDAIHASPPCQAYSVTTSIGSYDPNDYPRLVDDVRDHLIAAQRPWVIENVPGAPLKNALILCGSMFSLPTRRHRLFEMSHPIYFLPAACNHQGRAGSYVRDEPRRFVTVAGHMFSKASGSRALGIDWMTREELAEAIPPAYTEYIGRHLIAAVEAR